MLMCVCGSVNKISQKVFNYSTSFLVGAPYDTEMKRLDFERNRPGVRVGAGGGVISAR